VPPAKNRINISIKLPEKPEDIYSSVTIVQRRKEKTKEMDCDFLQRSYCHSFCMKRLRKIMKEAKPGKLVPTEIQTRYLPNTVTLFYRASGSSGNVCGLYSGDGVFE
jgi:hypothetical protein